MPLLRTDWAVAQRPRNREGRYAGQRQGHLAQAAVASGRAGTQPEAATLAAQTGPHGPALGLQTPRSTTSPVLQPSRSRPASGEHGWLASRLKALGQAGVTPPARVRSAEMPKPVLRRRGPQGVLGLRPRSPGNGGHRKQWLRSQWRLVAVRQWPFNSLRDQRQRRVAPPQRIVSARSAPGRRLPAPGRSQDGQFVHQGMEQGGA